MNQLKNKNAWEGRFCSPAELIQPAGGVNGTAQPMKPNGNGDSHAVIPAMMGVPAKRPANGFSNGETFPENGASEGARRIEQSIAYMREHLDRPLPVAKLAALANISPSHFFVMFKRRTGCAPMDYFTHLRMQHACRLLDTTSASVKEVAAVLGYDDPFYFSRVFKLVNHVPPSQYRMLRKQSSDAGPDVPTAATLPGTKNQGDKTAHFINENSCYVK